ncbi:MAG TPA: hypothetical protein VGB34_07475 [Candidatus Limnocylindria bacterium]|jgi:hypothetical protein
MSTNEETLRLVLEVGNDTDGDVEEVDRLTRRLRSEILDQEVESAELVTAGEIPEGARAGEVIAIGSLLVTLLPSVLPNLIDLLGGWLKRDTTRTIKIKLQRGETSVDVELDPRTCSTEELQGLVDTLGNAFSG